MGNELAINPKTIYTELQRLKPQIEAALPRHMSPDRMARIAYTQLRVNPKLFACTFESFMGCIMGAAQLGFEPGVNGQCYLIPYEDRKKGITVCTLVPGWKGLVDLVSRSGRASCWTGAVRAGDEFRYQLGSNPKLEHDPGDEDDGNFTHVYAVGWVKDSQWPVIDVWSRAKVLKHLNQYNKVGDRHYALQRGFDGKNDTNLEMYGRKVCLLQVIKYLPTSIELRDSLALEESALEGKQKMTIDMAISPGGLIADGPAADDVEAEGLMERLNWDPEKRSMFRDNYASNMADGLKYLRGEVEKMGRSTQTRGETQQTTTQQQTEAPTTLQGAPAAAPRGRGRGKTNQAPETQQGTAQEGDTAQSADSAGTTTEESHSASSSTTRQEEPKTAQTEPGKSYKFF